MHSDCLLLSLLLQFGLISACAFLVALSMSSSPKQPSQSQVNALSERLDHQDERFDQLEFKLDHLIRAFEKSPTFDQPKTSPHITADFMVRGSDRRKWLMYKSGQHEESESEGPDQPLPYGHREREREQGSSWRHGQGDSKSRRFATHRDDRWSNNYRESRNANPETDHRNFHEGYSDVTQR